MRKKIIAIALLIGSMTVLAGCGNKDFLDTVYTFNKAIISLPDGEIVEGEVQNWTDYADGDQIQVTIDGIVYLVHSSNITLINDVGQEN